MSLKIKKNGGASKKFMRITGNLLFIGRFVKSSEKTIIQIIRKYTSILIFLINPSNCFTGTYLKPSQHHLRLRSLCGIQPSTNVTKNSVLTETLLKPFY